MIKILLEILKIFPIEIETLEEALKNSISQNYHKILQTELLDFWIFLYKNLSFPQNFFNSNE